MLYYTLPHAPSQGGARKQKAVHQGPSSDNNSHERPCFCRLARTICLSLASLSVSLFYLLKCIQDVSRGIRCESRYCRGVFMSMLTAMTNHPYSPLDRAGRNQSNDSSGMHRILRAIPYQNKTERSAKRVMSSWLNLVYLVSKYCSRL